MQIGCIHPNKGCVYFVYPPPYNYLDNFYPGGISSLTAAAGRKTRKMQASIFVGARHGESSLIKLKLSR